MKSYDDSIWTKGTNMLTLHSKTRMCFKMESSQYSSKYGVKCPIELFSIRFFKYVVESIAWPQNVFCKFDSEIKACPIYKNDLLHISNKPFKAGVYGGDGKSLYQGLYRNSLSH